MTDSYEFNGRIQPINSVNIVARVTAWLDKQLFVEGTDVKKGDLLYTLEKPPFQAAVDRRKAAVALCTDPRAPCPCRNWFLTRSRIGKDGGAIVLYIIQLRKE